MTWRLLYINQWLDRGGSNSPLFGRFHFLTDAAYVFTVLGVLSDTEVDNKDHVESVTHILKLISIPIFFTGFIWAI